MKRSIRLKISLGFFGVIGFILFSLWIVNTFALEPFYINEKINELKTAYSEMDSLVMEAVGAGENILDYVREDGTEEEGDNADKAEGKGSAAVSLSSLLQEYSYKYNITIAVIDSVTNRALISSERDGEVLLKRAQAVLLGQQNEKYVKLLFRGENYKIIRNYVEPLDSSFIESIGYCSDNQTLVIMSTPVEGLQESVELSNKFLAYIGSLAFFIGGILVFFLTNRITRPIRTLSGISGRMGKLDFTAKYEGGEDDEIGILGRNMNLMSDKLKESIDELREANLALMEDIRKKEEIDAMRKDFVANVSHELKTPIALIRGYAEGLCEGLCEDEESRSYYLGVIIDEADKMHVLVKQLLTLSALESGVQKINPVSFDIAELLGGILESSVILLTDKEAEVDFSRTEGIFVYADEFKIEEVLTNFVSNAIHHVTKRGRIRADISVDRESKKVKVSVFNSGPPIPPEDVDRIWDKFYKVDKAHSRSYGGSGIGLSIVKAICDAHGAGYGVKNDTDGVVFWVELPLSSGDEPV